MLGIQDALTTHEALRVKTIVRPGSLRGNAKKQTDLGCRDVVFKEGLVLLAKEGQSAIQGDEFFSRKKKR